MDSTAHCPILRQWSGRQEVRRCPNEDSEYFKVKFTRTEHSLTGQMEGTAHCGNKIIEGEFTGTVTENIAFITFQTGFTEKTAPAEAILVLHDGHGY